MSTYETTAGLGDERVRILPRRGLIKNHYYTRATHRSWRLCGAIVVISWRGGDAERYKSLTRDETFVSEASFLGPPESYARMGRAEALVARRFIGVPKELRSNGERRSDGALYFGMPKSFSEVRDDEGYQPLRPKCRMRSSAIPLRNKGTKIFVKWANRREKFFDVS